MKITFLGHAGFLLEYATGSAIIDPFITGHPHNDGKLKLEDLKADYIFVSHGHQDHILDALELAKMNDATLISNFEIINHFMAQGYEKVQYMNTGASAAFPWGSVKATNAIHTSSFPDGTYAGTPCGFIFQSDECTVYFAGDTALTYDMKLIAEEFHVDVALLPIGDTFTMGYQDACKAADFVDAKECIGMHYNTFPPISIDTGAAQDYFKSKSKELILLELGESREFTK